MTVTPEADPGAPVFVSYSRRDFYFAESLTHELGKRGVAAFLDVKDLAPAPTGRPACSPRSTPLPASCSSRHRTPPRRRTSGPSGSGRSRRGRGSSSSAGAATPSPPSSAVRAGRLPRPLRARAPRARREPRRRPTVREPRERPARTRAAVGRARRRRARPADPRPVRRRRLRRARRGRAPRRGRRVRRVRLALRAVIPPRRMSMLRLALTFAYFAGAMGYLVVQQHGAGPDVYADATIRTARDLPWLAPAAVGVALAGLATVCSCDRATCSAGRRPAVPGTSTARGSTRRPTTLRQLGSAFTTIPPTPPRPSGSAATCSAAGAVEDDGDGGTAVLLLTNRTRTAWLDAQTGLRDADRRTVVGAGIRAPASLEWLWRRQFTDFRRWRPERSARVLVPEAFATLRPPPEVRNAHRVLCAAAALLFVAGGSASQTAGASGYAKLVGYAAYFASVAWALGAHLLVRRSPSLALALARGARSRGRRGRLRAAGAAADRRRRSPARGARGVRGRRSAVARAPSPFPRVLDPGPERPEGAQSRDARAPAGAGARCSGRPASRSRGLPSSARPDGRSGENVYERRRRRRRRAVRGTKPIGAELRHPRVRPDGCSHEHPARCRDGKGAPRNLRLRPPPDHRQ